MSIQKRIASLVNRKDSQDSFRNTSYALCKTFGWDYYTLISQPIPFVLDMIDVMNEEAKKHKEKSPNSKSPKMKGRKK